MTGKGHREPSGVLAGLQIFIWTASAYMYTSADLH